jgi:hypothetical protein
VPEHDFGVREFTAPVRPSVVRLVLAIVLPLVVLVPMGGLMVVALGMSPATYTIADGALAVRSGDLFSGTRTVRLADVTGARVVALRGARRTAGTALPGFCAGRFTYPDLGTVWQVTDCGGQGVLVEARGEAHPIVISPPDPAGFVASLGAGTEQTVTLPSPEAGPLRAVLLVVAALGTVSAIMVSALMILGPSQMRYLVGDGALEVRTLFGRKRWPTAGARARGHTPSKLRRVAGTAAPGYYTGIFRESGETTRVYATDVERVLLFEGPARVIVSPEDRVGMLRALEEEGVTVVHHV